MVNNKNVQFEEKMDENPSPKFIEPAGMTTIDLRRLSAIHSKLFESTKSDRQCRQKTCKLVILVTFISFGCTFLILFLPNTGIYSMKSAMAKQDEPNQNELTTIIELYLDKLQMCKITESFQDCCVIFSDLDTRILLDGCTVENVLNTILNHERGLLTDFTKERNDPLRIYKNSDNTYDDFYDYNSPRNTDDNEKDVIIRSPSVMKVSAELLYDTNLQSPKIENNIIGITPEKRSSNLLNTYIERIRSSSRKSPMHTKTSIKDIDTPKLDSKEYKNFKLDINNTNVNITKPNHLSQQKIKRESVNHNLNTYKPRSPIIDQFPNYDSCQQSIIGGQKQCVATYNPQVSSGMPIMQQQLPLTQFIRSSNVPFIISQPQYTYVAPNIQQTLSEPNYYSTSNSNPFQITSPTGQYYVCNIVPASSNSVSSGSSNVIAGLPGVEVRTTNSAVPFLLGSSRRLFNHMDDINNKTRSSRGCPYGEEMCLDQSKCIHTRLICDSEVNCADASDEAFCECKMRLDPVRICDGYTDCPNGEDEIGCFGCKVDMFNCDDWSQIRDATCIPINKRCDGIRHCPTGKDEQDCSVLTAFLGISDQLFKFSNNIGFLHINYKGKWFPACSNTELWAIQACYGENGPNRIPPLTHMVAVDLDYDGPYLNGDPTGDHEIVPSCVEDHAVYVECPQPTCGIRKNIRNPYRAEEVDTSQEEIMDKFRGRRDSTNATNAILVSSRVVGGRACQPAAWPWVVSIYRNGIFHCGGVLISESWLLTAAHCVTKYWQFYYEVEAGMLRRFSYSPMEQTKYISRVIPHEKYDREKLKNDIALMKLNKPVVYNRYVKPICLPTEITAGRSHDKGPPPGTICTAVGWGATTEHGNDPDHLREVEVPILPSCKHKEDNDGNEICAGLMEGGKDACQGDSGGPFMCRNPNFPEQWYVAGIVSHGEGCARPNEPGVYTKVGLYLNWIYESAKDGHPTSKTPLHKCPGYTCHETGRCISKKRLCDKLVDCLHADDERACDTAPSVITTLMKRVMRHRPIILGSTANFSRDLHQKKVTPVSNNNAHSTTVHTFINHTTTSSSDTITTNAPLTVKTTSTSVHLNPDLEIQRPHIDNSLTTSDAPVSDQNHSISNSKDLPARITIMPTSIANGSLQIAAFAESEYLAEKSDRNKVVLLADKYFTCKIMMEKIPANFRCDKVIDCQDGSDEADCSCVDYLKNSHPKTICDGTTDCSDLSDELDCNQCKHNEFYCRKSSLCIPSHQRCNNKINCPLKEDERDCVALSEQYNLIIDEDLRPFFSSSGLVLYNFQGEWRPLCGNISDVDAEIASDICVSLGFLDYQNFFELPVYDQPINMIFSQFSSSFKRITNDKCTGLYLKCSKTIIDTHKLGSEDKFNFMDEEYAFPSIASVYSDGYYKCTGVLLRPDWVLTSIHCFEGILELDKHYVVVLFGAGRLHLKVAGPHEQLLKVVEVLSISTSDAILLRLQGNIEYNRYVRPIHFVQKFDQIRSFETCLAIGLDTNSTLKVIRLAGVKNCTSRERRCFKRIDEIQQTCHDSIDDENDLNHRILHSEVWSGCIVCDSGTGFYPAAVFHESNGHCGFTKAKEYTAVEIIKNDIFHMMKLVPFIVEPPICPNHGFRCKLGQCLPFEQVCDGVPDCKDFEDESPLFCDMQDMRCHLQANCVCTPSQLRCANNRCIPRSQFCDRRDDCGDGSDEPDRCNCISYLQLTNPGKICDGTRHCLDRSDEDPRVCQCSTAGHFSCEGGRYCVPTDMVCDGFPDCPNGDDEKKCFSLLSNEQNSNIGEVLTKTAGIWHSGCFPEHLTTHQLQDICMQLGFNGSSVFYLKPPNGTNQTANRPILEQFNAVWIHRNGDTKLRLAMRSGRNPFVQFEPDPDCHKLFLQCLY